MHCSKCLVTITELKEAVNSLAMVNWQTRSMLLIIYESTTVYQTTTAYTLTMQVL
jgi:hypothetical protein